ncbi:16S rRNA (cytidine(1402)-2'-O)-methyltransferase [Candidatus Peregrinibacteria bacterium CG_4_9_14_0_2_um_filter_53_11]|nr:MAG: 16S rRNA (cytidine(1402)-2'-O)-methyltransferase [Candidatus Peregrinibacteria bacterium CG_4_9_14_0_2_um_filter_53_11]
MLSIVPTPIGNLEDITLRALRTLKEADYVIAEDTRHSGILLKHFEIKTPQLSFHSHSGPGQVERILGLLRDGKNCAMISDAGMPGISDPGYRLIRAVIEEELPLTVLPGPTAATTAVVASGLASHSFLYIGFLPLKKGRQTALTSLAELPYTLIFYEAPHRIVRTLEDLAKFFGEERKVAVCRELSKAFEEVRRSTLAEALAHFKETKPRGEFTLVLEGANS